MSTRKSTVERQILQGNLWSVGKHLVWIAATFAKTLFAQTCRQTSGFEIPGADFRNDHVDEVDVDVENVADVDVANVDVAVVDVDVQNVADVDVF